MLTVASFIRESKKGLSLLTGHKNQDNVVSASHVSDLPDPTTGLHGQEILLTNGLPLAKLECEPDDYLDRLVKTGVSALGFGTSTDKSLPFQAVPEILISLADERNLPLFEVPDPITFLEITKVIYDLLANERYRLANAQIAFSSTIKSLATQETHLSTILHRFSQEISGQAWIVDHRKSVIAKAATQEFTEVCESFLNHSLGHTPRYSKSSARFQNGRVLVSQELKFDSSTYTFFWEAPDTEFQLGKILGDIATTIIWLNLNQEIRLSRSRALLKQQVTNTWISSQTPLRQSMISTVDARNITEYHLCVIEVQSTDDSSRSNLINHLNTSITESYATQLDDYLVALLPRYYLSAAQLQLLCAHHPIKAIGVSPAVANQTPAHLLELAIYTCNYAKSRESSYEFFEHTMFGGLAGKIGEPTMQAISDEVLQPILDHAEAKSLIESLQAFLSANGVWKVAARQTGLHHQTLKKRISHIEHLTKRDFDNPDDRFELWLALKTRVLFLS